jgi:hypothetical protein
MTAVCVCVCVCVCVSVTVNVNNPVNTTNPNFCCFSVSAGIYCQGNMIKTKTLIKTLTYPNKTEKQHKSKFHTFNSNSV